MPLIMLLLLVVWTLLVFRLLCFRATQSGRSILKWLALGAAAGPLATALADKFFNSYRWEGTYYFILIDAARVFMLLTPVLLLWSRPSWRWGSSVVDAFLAAFLIGFGYDIIGPLVAAASYEQLNSVFSFLPPGAASLPSVTVAGYGYWCGLAALAFAAGWRFGRGWIAACVAGTFALILSGADLYYDFVPPEQVSSAMLKLTMHRSLTPWLVIAALLAAALLEKAWQGKSEAKASFLAEMQSVLTALISLKPKEAARVGALLRLRRQNAIVQAERKRSPNDKTLQSYAAKVSELLQRAERSRPAEESAGSAELLRWLRQRALQITVAAAFLLLCIVFSMPSLRSLGSSLWTWLPLSQPLVPFQQNFLSMLLAAVAFRYFLIAPAEATSVRSDEMAQIAAERRILQAGLAVTLAALLYPGAGELFDFSGALAAASGLNVRNGWNGLQLNTLVLLLAAMAGGLTLRRAERWRDAPPEARSRAAAHNLVTGFRAFALVWIGFNFFVQLQLFLHARYGPAFFTKFGRNGNSLAELAGGMITAAFIFGASWLLQIAAGRAESFLSGGPPRTAETRAARSAAAGGRP